MSGGGARLGQTFQCFDSIRYQQPLRLACRSVGLILEQRQNFQQVDGWRGMNEKSLLSYRGGKQVQCGAYFALHMNVALVPISPTFNVVFNTLTDYPLIAQQKRMFNPPGLRRTTFFRRIQLREWIDFRGIYPANERATFIDPAALIRQ